MRTDAHVHLFPPEFVREREKLRQCEPYFGSIFVHPSAPMGTLPELLEVMSQDGIGRALVCGFPWRDGGRARAHNQYLLALGRQHPGRLIPLASVDPLSNSAEQEATFALAEGAAGLGEIGCYHDDLGAPGVLERAARLGEICAEAAKPMLLHTNEPVGHRYPGKSPMTLAGLERLLAQCPRTRFQLAHLGGGIFFFAWLRRGIRHLLENCIADCAAMPFLYRPRALRYLMESEVPVAFGSDWPLLRPARYLRDIQRAELSPQQQQCLWQDTAATFWGLSQEE